VVSRDAVSAVRDGAGGPPPTACLQGQTDPGTTLPAPHLSGDPGAAGEGVQQDRPAAGRPTRPDAPWKERPMPSKPKNETTDEAREQARRALQTSMDTRQ
jgi:hypothetical protein